MNETAKDKLMEHSFSVKLRTGIVLGDCKLAGRKLDFPFMVRKSDDGVDLRAEISWELAQRLMESGKPLSL